MPRFESLLRSHENAERRSQYFDTCLFDLDDTLYPLSSGLAPACKLNIQAYMMQKLGFTKENVLEANIRFYREYGTTMAGLRACDYSFDFDDYHKFVHGQLPYQNLKPDPALRLLLDSLPQRKFVFTNSDRVHANKCLNILGLSDCFENVICFETIMEHPPLSPWHPSCDGSNSRQSRSSEDSIVDSWQSLYGPRICCKPQAEAFARALAISHAEPHRTMFFDDSVRNISAAKRMGLHTVLVGTREKPELAEYAVQSLHELKDAIPQLWETCGSSSNSSGGFIQEEAAVSLAAMDVVVSI